MPWTETLILSLANASIAFTLAETRLFARPRAWIMARNAWLGHLSSCGYCLGHWSAGVLTACYGLRLLHHWWPLDFVLTSLVLAWLSGFQWAALCWLMQKAGK